MIYEILAQVKIDYEARRKEYIAFRDAIALLPDHEQREMLKERNEREDKQEKFRTEERRHREIVEAIRSTSFWRFGI